ncbi:cation-translocating P-type ATPase [Candidatus Peregrinibacteria bacterium]|nr:MAG: cation-translocating P-type ATPase [Candidatus Peregrinibacteria bacterium]
METASFKIEGMTCASCVSHIEHDLKKTKGVHHVMVNFAMEQAAIHYDPAQVSEKELIEVIKRTGYKADPLESKDHHDPHSGHEDHSAHAGAESSEQVIKRRSLFILSAVLSVPLLLMSFFINWKFEHHAMLVLAASILLVGKEFFVWL